MKDQNQKASTSTRRHQPERRGGIIKSWKIVVVCYIVMAYITKSATSTKNIENAPSREAEDADGPKAGELSSLRRIASVKTSRGGKLSSPDGRGGRCDLMLRTRKRKMLLSIAVDGRPISASEARECVPECLEIGPRERSAGGGWGGMVSS